MKRYFSQGLFGRDLLGSIVVFLVALPLCMGIAIASGMPPAAGLVTGIIGGIVAGAIGGSPLQVSGPTAGMAVLVFELVREHGAAALGPAVLLAGLIQMVAGLCRTGVWFRMISPAVVAGMLCGLGVLIVASQLHVVIDAVPRAGGLENFAALPGALLDALEGKAGSVSALGVGLCTMAIMLGWEKFRPQRLRIVPGALLAVIVVTTAVSVLGADVNKVALPANLLAVVSLPTSESFASLGHTAVLIAALTFAMMASAETLVSASAIDRMHDGKRSDYDQELAAQGVGNVLCGVLGVLPMAGVIVRSAANVQAGSATRMATIMHGLGLLVFATLLPWLIRATPVACLGGILVYTGAKMINIRQMKLLAAYGRGTAVIYFVTTLSIVVTDLLTGVLIGFALSVVRLALQSSRLRVGFKSHHEPGKVMLQLDGSATFLKAPVLARMLERVPPNTHVLLDLGQLRHIDQACLELLTEWGRNAKARGCELVVDWTALHRRVEGWRQAA
jgi:MFS superfamily sulfate permease-like transporter